MKAVLVFTAVNIPTTLNTWQERGLPAILYVSLLSLVSVLPGQAQSYTWAQKQHMSFLYHHVPKFIETGNTPPSSVELNLLISHAGELCRIVHRSKTLIIWGPILKKILGKILSLA